MEVYYVLLADGNFLENYATREGRAQAYRSREEAELSRDRADGIAAVLALAVKPSYLTGNKAIVVTGEQYLIACRCICSQMYEDDDDTDTDDELYWNSEVKRYVAGEFNFLE